jgi:hypothetical protein
MNETPDPTAHDKVVNAVDSEFTDNQEWDNQQYDEEDWPRPCGELVNGVPCGKTSFCYRHEIDENGVSDRPLCWDHFMESSDSDDRFQKFIEA